MKYVLKQNLKVSHSNVNIDNATIGNWCFNWKLNRIAAYSFIQTKGTNPPQIFLLLEDVNSLNLGLLVDVLTLAHNVNVNTDITISLEIDYQLYRLTGNPRKPTTISEYESLCSTNQCIENGQGDKEWPVRTNYSIATTLSSEELFLANYLLQELSKKSKFLNAELKLLNYWRRGVDLKNLTYWDESFLAFFKILEYFEKRCDVSNSSIPFRYRTDREKTAYRMCKGAGISKIDKNNIKLLTDFIIIRNNWDIAHTRVKYLPQNLEGGLYFTYYYNTWDTHHNLKEVARLFILNFLSIKNMELVVDGGLYKLNKTK